MIPPGCCFVCEIEEHGLSPIEALAFGMGVAPMLVRGVPIPDQMCQKHREPMSVGMDRIAQVLTQRVAEKFHGR